MKLYMRNLNLLAGRITQNHIRFILLMITLILFVLGAGAPAGDVGPGSG